MLDEITNIQALLLLIDGLQYDEVRKEFTHNGIIYKLRDVKDTDSNKQNYYFVNIANPVDIVIITCNVSTGLPLFDNFNDKEIDKNLRQKEYWQNYYNRKRKQELAPRKCEICGKIFMPKTNKSRYCSEECQYKAKLEQMKAKRQEQNTQKEPVICVECGKEFIPVNNRKKFCSVECYRRYSSRKEYEKIKGSTQKKKKCKICKKYFVGDKRQKYCSKECYAKSRVKAKS